MLISNPFDVSFAQSILDSIVKSAGVIFSAKTLGVMISFIIKMGMIATVVFALISAFFVFFAYLKNKGSGLISDSLDGFIGFKVSPPNGKEISK